MGGNIMKDQWQGANYRGFPVEEKNDSSAVTAISGETVQFYYSAAGVRTIDAGQAAGVAVEAVLAKNNVKNSQGKIEATKQDTSLTFTSTAFTTEVAIDLTVMESMDNVPWATRLAALTAGLSNGQYVVDYSKGILYGKKASTQVTLTSAAYSVNSEVLGSISIDEFPAAAVAADGTANPTTTSVRSFPFGFNGATWDRLRAGITTASATLTGFLNTLPWSIYNVTPATRTDGQGGPVQSDNLGNTKVAEQFAPQYENNADGVAWSQMRPIASSTAAISTDLSAALEASTVTKASAGRLYGGRVRIDSTHATATYYIQFLNAASLPADGAVTFLVSSLKVQHVNGTDSTVSVDYSNIGGVYASTGIVMCLSTSEFTKTISGAFTASTIFYA